MIAKESKNCRMWLHESIVVIIAKMFVVDESPISKSW